MAALRRIARVQSIGAAVFALVAACGDQETTPHGDDVGADGCAPGETRRETGNCLPSGTQDSGCAAGEVALAGGGCHAAGVPPEACGAGFAPDGAMGCTAILPSDPCAQGEIATVGDTSCRAVAPCAPGTWGDIPVDDATQFVDGSYAGLDSDGSQAKPWTTIQDAVDGALAGATVAIAAGTYVEDLQIASAPVRLWGRCPSMVAIVGSATPPGAVFIHDGGSATEIHDLAIAGGVAGIVVSGAKGILLRRVWIHDTSRRGVDVESSIGTSELTVEQTLIERVAEVGAFSYGASLTVDASVIRRTQPSAVKGGIGRGIQGQADASGIRARLTIRGSLIDESIQDAIAVQGSDATIEDSVVRGTQALAADHSGGEGLMIQDDPVSRLRSRVTVRSSVFTDNRETGIFAMGSDITIEASIIRATQPQLTDQTSGRGVGVYKAPTSGERAAATIRWSIIEQNHELGVFVAGADASLEGCIVRDTQARPADMTGGHGIQVQDIIGDPTPSVASIRGCVFERNLEAGIAVVGSQATVEGTLVRDTKPSVADGSFGDGLAVDQSLSPNGLVVTASRIEQSARAGIANFGSDASIENTRLECNAIEIDGEPDTTPFAFADLGGNVCGCGADGACAVLSASLAPPTALGAPPAP